MLVPTFPILRAGESHTTERRKFRNFSKLQIRATPSSFLSRNNDGGTRKGRIFGWRLDFVNLVRERSPIKAPRPAGGIRRGSTVMSVTATTGMVIPERRRPVGQSCLQDPKVTQRSFDLRRPLRKRFAKSRSTARYVGAALIRRKIPLDVTCPRDL